MPNTLIAWELGSGLGHVGPLRPVIQELFRRGHRVSIATTNVPLCQQACGGLGAEILSSPALPPSARQVKIPCTFCDVLHNAGYASAERVVESVRAWLRLIDAVSPERVLADHAPTAMLAARIRRLPTAVLGTGFLCPPDINPLPSLHPVITEPHWMQEVETTVLSSMNAALETFRGEPLPHVAALYGQATIRFLLTLPELDHYPNRVLSISDHYVRLFDSLPGPQVAWPAGQADPRVFVYLRDGTSTEPLLRGLAMKGIPTVAFAPRLSKAGAEALRGTSVNALTTPVDLKPLLSSCSAAVLHGGHISVCEFLLAGVPMLILPLSAEQSITARRLSELGVGLDAPVDDLNAIGGALEDLLTHGCYADRARAYATQYAAYDQALDLRKVVDALGE